MEDSLYPGLALIRQQSPLILNITNQVTMDFVANGLLAIGASPVMSNSGQELEELVGSASSVTINIGTLDDEQVRLFEMVVATCKWANKKLILDPVGAGATSYRTSVALGLLSLGGISILKGNASEIIALSGGKSKAKGVDSMSTSDEAITAALQLSKNYDICVVVSGAKDLVVNKGILQSSELGHSMMSRITGMGCLFCSIIAAFYAIEDDPLIASFQATQFFGFAGKITAENPAAVGPASFKTAFIDALYNLQ